jgi:ATP-dependent Lhr-like helicase
MLPRELLQTVAVCELMLEGWVEPPSSGGIDLSTLAHQIISTIAERGAVTAEELYVRLCREGPFRTVAPDLFARLLRALGSTDIVEQGSDGRLILGLFGENLRARRDFYAAFASRTEYAVLAGDRMLGTLPLATLPKPGDHIVFAARRWQVKDVDAERQEVHVDPAKRRKRPSFVSGGGAVHHRVVERMRAILADDRPIPYLDGVAGSTLESARSHARTHRLAERRWIPVSRKTTVWLTWAGTVETATYEALLGSVGIQTRNEFVGLVCACSIADLSAALEPWSERVPDLLTLAEHVLPKRRRKYDEHLPDDLLDEGLASYLRWVSVSLT